jgi:hypothetical protein
LTGSAAGETDLLLIRGEDVDADTFTRALS